MQWNMMHDVYAKMDIFYLFIEGLVKVVVNIKNFIEKLKY